MNLILIDKNEVDENHIITLKNHRFEHIKNVLKTQSGDSVKIGIINEKMGDGICLNINSNCAKIKIKNLTTDPPKPLPLTLLIAMQRPKTMKKVIQSATAMGVKNIYIIETWKVEKSYWRSPILNDDKLKEQLLLGLEQSIDTILPKLTIKKRFKPFIEDELPTLLKNSKGYVAHPDSTINCPRGLEEHITLAIGPEGGFTQYEVDKLISSGMKHLSIGNRILRTEFAVTAIISKIF